MNEIALADQVGFGIRSCHYDEFLDHSIDVPFLELLSENYMFHDNFGRHVAKVVSKKYPIVLHGVSLSIGTPNFDRADYLRNLKALIDLTNPFVVSDHLCFAGMQNRNTHDLLPLPYNLKTLESLLPAVDHVQESLGRTIALENVSSYVDYKRSDMNEVEFLNEVCSRSGCKWLLDVNNILVNGFNFDCDPYLRINQVDPDHVVQYHIAGHTDKGTYLFDTHIGPVPDSVMDLFRHTLRVVGSRPTILEWDDDIPCLNGLVSEKKRIQTLVNQEKMEVS